MNLAWKQIGRSAVVAALAFLVVEWILEGILYLVFGISDNRLWAAHFDQYGLGFWRYLGLIISILANFFFIMLLYSIARPFFNSHGKAILGISGVVLAIQFLAFANLMMQGLFPFSIWIWSLITNIVELPVAIYAGVWYLTRDEQVPE
ncbi:MAG: hypothetical protein K9N11_09885 [Lentisphaeria bacterium]|nr:hypothetical protein [Candidatus Neomarinimicrobiota bacterium]MCF7843142.1 hypothetical protein [Lentisphaeria bacterium]